MEFWYIDALDSARADRMMRAKQYAQDCVLLAVVTAEPLAAELIDKAIGYHAEATQDRVIASPTLRVR
ncbi:hypothetical protein ACFOKI_09745 [Sphingomonas qilianensis]|uniref:Uncharacterized protein n=1 Tax=Sphingomonas qilianensis TaxID=1736690 RepID=A0ABU9XQ79_9SPHN